MVETFKVMAETHRMKRGFATILAIVCIAAATVVLAPAASATKDYGSLTARWWQWVYAQPAVDVPAVGGGTTNTNPVLDSTGEYATVGQEHGIGPAGKFFFLTGTFGRDAVRTVTVPRGKALFFPIFNISVDNAVDPPTDYGVPKLRALAKTSIDAASGLQATFDREPVAIFRSTSPVFGYTLPDKDSIYDYFNLHGPQFEGRVKPAVADGYWAYIPPPPPGHHVLKFRSAAPNFSLKVRYELTVS